MNQKIDNAMHALVMMDRGAVSSVTISAMLGCSRLTAIRLVCSLRKMGCTIYAEREGHDYWYTVADWGVFSKKRVLEHVARARHAKRADLA